MVSLEVGPNMTADLVALGWLPAPDRVDKDALALGERLLHAVARNCGANRDWIRSTRPAIAEARNAWRARRPPRARTWVCPTQRGVRRTSNSGGRRPRRGREAAYS